MQSELFPLAGSYHGERRGSRPLLRFAFARAPALAARAARDEHADMKFGGVRRTRAGDLLVVYAHAAALGVLVERGLGIACTGILRRRRDLVAERAEHELSRRSHAAVEVYRRRHRFKYIRAHGRVRAHARVFFGFSEFYERSEPRPVRR